MLPLAFAAALAAASAVACSTEPTEITPGELAQATVDVPSKAPSLQGVVVELGPDQRVLLEHRPVREGCQRQALARLGPETRLVRRDGTGANAGDLRPGQRVTAWFGDVEMRSCPVQVDAVAIIIE